MEAYRQLTEGLDCLSFFVSVLLSFAVVAADVFEASSSWMIYVLAQFLAVLSQKFATFTVIEFGICTDCFMPWSCGRCSKPITKMRIPELRLRNYL